MPQQSKLVRVDSTDYSQTSTVNSTRVCHFHPILYLEFLMLNHNPQVHLGPLLCQEVWLYTGRLILENPRTWESQTSFCDDEDIKESSSSCSKSDKELHMMTYMVLVTLEESWASRLQYSLPHCFLDSQPPVVDLQHKVGTQWWGTSFLFHPFFRKRKQVCSCKWTLTAYIHIETATFSQRSEREREREREREYPPSDLTCLLQTQSSSGFCKTSKKPTEIEPQHTKHHFSQKQKQQKNVTQNQSTTKTNTQNKTKKLTQTKHKRNLKQKLFFSSPKTKPQKLLPQAKSQKSNTWTFTFLSPSLSLSLSFTRFVANHPFPLYNHYITKKAIGSINSSPNSIAFHITPKFQFPIWKP